MIGADRRWRVRVTYEFETFGYSDQALEAAEKGRAELELYLGRPVRTKRRVIAQLHSSALHGDTQEAGDVPGGAGSGS